MMDSNINVRLECTIHGTPTSKHQTMCNPWNLKLKLSDNVQSMELKPSDNVQPMELQPVGQCATHGSLNSNTIHGTPTSKCRTTCNPWNLKLKLLDNVQPMELHLQHDYLLIFCA